MEEGRTLRVVSDYLNFPLSRIRTTKELRWAYISVSWAYLRSRIVQAHQGYDVLDTREAHISHHTKAQLGINN